MDFRVKVDLYFKEPQEHVGPTLAYSTLRFLSFLSASVHTRTQEFVSCVITRLIPSIFTRGLWDPRVRCGLCHFTSPLCHAWV